ncbi:MAG: 23S rRNA (adenine(2030)-N(6))-methyltransferase RlmJ, partial [Pseudomonas aeruginosa]|nr:23S rRNA (adenine(2030)-N(6))-methyltransferase RlmJ [Pseudomonas aeruginosa]
VELDEARHGHIGLMAVLLEELPLQHLAELRDLLPWLAEVMAQSQGGWRLDWLVAE